MEQFALADPVADAEADADAQADADAEADADADRLAEPDAVALAYADAGERPASLSRSGPKNERDHALRRRARLAAGTSTSPIKASAARRARRRRRPAILVFPPYNQERPVNEADPEDPGLQHAAHRRRPT